MTYVNQIARRVFRVPTYSRQSEALHAVIAHSTPRRFFNLLLVEAEFRLRRTRVYGRPYVLVIDPTNVCNLRCPLCPTGLLKQGRRGQMISWETFTRIVDQAAPWSYKVNLFNWGEPLLHPHLFDMIRYVRGKNLGTTMSTNFSVDLDDASIDALVTSGLEFICLSIDGATQENYGRYRRKGDLRLVLSNVRRLVKRRRELNCRTPVIEWQFIPMKHNEHEEQDARRLAADIGVDRFRCIPVGLPFDSADAKQLQETWFPITLAGAKSSSGAEIPSNEQANTACHFLYRYLVVNPDGKASPCCVVYGEGNDFGDTKIGDFGSLWNNANYRSARAHYARKGQVEVPTVCDRCNLFVKRSVHRPSRASVQQQ